jgi:CRISPR system Cascade subunit CasC
MKIEIHVLQNFAPSNLNRDDTGAPKDCELGGYRRARISSQCQKRAVRQLFTLQGLVAEESLAARTKRLAHQVADVLEEKNSIPRAEGAELVIQALKGCGLKTAEAKGDNVEDGWKTQYLLYVPRRSVDALATLVAANKDTLAALAGEAPSDDAKKVTKAAAKKADKAAFPKDLAKAFTAILEDARGAADLALFGRMIADQPSWNVDASCQVAHAISTNKVQMDFDFYTAVDDFKPDDNAGADMMGTIQFNSSCFYRYAVLDVDALAKNLGGKDAAPLAKKTVEAFIQAFFAAIPTGKQNSMAAHNPPSYALAVVSDKGQPVSLANAFLKPATPKGEKDLVDVSVEKLEGYLSNMRELVNENALLTSWADRDLAKSESGVVRQNKLKGFFEAVTARAIGGAA